MTPQVHGYLSDLGRHLHLEPREKEEILQELRVHIEDRAREFIEAGFSSDDALAQAVDRLGDTHDIASDLYEVQSRGSWYHTVLAVLPHVLIALMFALHLWTTPGWVVLMLMVAVSISIFGWRKGRPRWTYPWLGYCLVVPMVSWGLAMSAVGYGAWGVLVRGSLPLDIPIYAVSFIYIAFSLWVVIRFVSKVARPDWVMASLAILPIPFLAYWFFYFYHADPALQPSSQLALEVDRTVSVVFLIVAATTAVFFRIGRRLIRVTLLVITAPSMTILAWLSYQGGVGYMAVFAFSAVSLAILLSPALFDLKGSRSEPHLTPFEPSSETSPG